jgi:hypothetical protein
MAMTRSTSHVKGRSARIGHCHLHAAANSRASKDLIERMRPVPGTGTSMRLFAFGAALAWMTKRIGSVMTPRAG